MSGAALITVVLALGMRHGVDPDHLSIIDGLSRFHPSRWNGVLFALGHGIIVTILAVGFGKLLAAYADPYTAWILLLLGVANLWRLWRPREHKHPKDSRLFGASPLLLGVLFGMGFETASQLSAILLAGQLNPWVLGFAFTIGMMLVDGTDGLLAARTQQLALTGHARSRQSSRVLGALVVVVSLSLAAGEFGGIDLNRFALPMGIVLFATVVGLRVWGSGGRSAQPLASAKEVEGRPF
jgi:high-affinity nickel-transport protein